MTRFFEKRDPWGHGLALWVLAAMVFVLPPTWWMVRQFDWSVAVEQPISERDPARQKLAWVQSEFPGSDSLLISWTGNSLDDPRVRRLAIKLAGTISKDGVRRGGLPEIRSAVTPQMLIRQMVQNGVPQDEAIRRLSGTLAGTGTLKVRLTETARKHRRRIDQSLVRQIREELDIAVTITQPTATPADADGNEDMAVDEDEPEDGTFEDEESEEDEPLLADRPWDFQIGWPGMAFRRMEVRKVRELVNGFRLNGRGSKKKRRADRPIAECFLTPGSPVAISVTLTDAGRAGGDETLRVIRQAADSVGIPPEHLSLTGRLVTSQQLSQAVQQVAWNRDYPITHFHKRSPLLFSALVMIVLTLTLVRGIRTAIMVLISAGFATLLTVALLPIAQSRMTMLLIAVPTVVSLLTICGSVYFLGHWRAAARQNRLTAVARAVDMSRRPCLLSALTTMVALFSLLSSPLAPVRDFGLYAGIGCLISMVVVLYVLPSLLQFLPLPVGEAGQPSPSAEQPDVRSVGEKERDTGAGRWAANLAVKFRVPAMACGLLLLPVGFCGLKFLHSDVSAARLFSPTARVLQDAAFQEDKLAGVLPVEMVVRFDTAARDHLSFLERMELVRRIEANLRSHPAVSGAFSLADLQPVSSPPPSPKAGLLRKARYKKKSHRVEARLIGSKNSTVSSLLTVAQKSAELQIAPGRRLLMQRGDELWRITARVTQRFDEAADGPTHTGRPEAVSDEFNNIVRSVLKTHAGAEHVMVGSVPLQIREQKAVLDSLLLGIGITTVIITLVLMVLLANPIAGFLTMLPALFPVGIVLGILSWCGESIGFGSLIAVTLALGMAVDATLHVVIRFQAGLNSNLSRRDALAEALERCVPAIWVAGVIAGMGALLLSSSDLLIVQRFGLLTAAVTTVGLLANTILLPTLLVGPVGALIEAAIQRGRSDALEQQQAAAARLDRQNSSSIVAAPHWNSRPSSTRSTSSAD